MAQGFDPGLTTRYTGGLRRIINKDGSFNVRKTSTSYHLYLHLITMSWLKFYSLAFCCFLVANLLFAEMYVLLGADNLVGGDVGMSPLATAFFFSTQTLTTVGYGHIAPKGFVLSSLAAFEGMLGVMGFAVITGLLYGRVSRPSAKLAFSRSMVVAPYEDTTALQFRIANARENVLMDIEATVLLMTVVTDAQGHHKRSYTELELERKHVFFVPLTWTIVHPIRESSPLWGKTSADLKALEAELLILIRFFDDTFSQTVNSRHSYRSDEIRWNERFDPAFFFDKHGDMVLQLDRVDNTKPIGHPQQESMATNPHPDLESN
jgi:inward rectifier potassium channel